MPSRKWNQFNDLVSWENLATVPGQMREEYVAAKKQRLLNNLDESKYATLQLDSNIRIYPLPRSKISVKELTLKEYIMEFSGGGVIAPNWDGYSSHFVLCDTKDILNFSSKVHVAINTQWENILRQDYYGCEYKKELYENEKKYIEIHTTSTMQFYNFLALCYKFFSQNKHWAPFDWVIKLEKQPVPSNAVRQFLSKKEMTDIEH